MLCARLLEFVVQIGACKPGACSSAKEGAGAKASKNDARQDRRWIVWRSQSETMAKNLRWRGRRGHYDDAARGVSTHPALVDRRSASKRNRDPPRSARVIPFSRRQVRLTRFLQGIRESPMKPPMKRIIVCCDHTWNDADTQTARPMWRSWPGGSMPIGHERVLQVVLYIRGSARRGSHFETVLDGVTGPGIDDNILAAYMFLAQNYYPGDRSFCSVFRAAPIPRAASPASSRPAAC